MNFKVPKKSKYKNKQVMVLGQKAASKREAKRFIELTLLERQKLIYGLKTQVPFELIPAQRLSTGYMERAVKYIADFVYTNDKGQLVVEDAKGVKTPEYVIKRKLMKMQHNIEIIEV